MKINKKTIIRLLILIVTLINQVLTMFNMPNICEVLKIDNETMTILITNSVTILSALWCAWKNNSITPKAIVSDAIKAICNYDELLEVLKKED